MTDTLSRRKFLKTGLAATAAVVVGPRLARADNHPLFEKTWIRSLELSNRAIRSSTWSGVGDRKGYVTDRALEFYGELARGDIGLILTGYQYVMTNGQGLPYMLGNYDDTQAEGLKKLVDTVHREGGKIAAQLVHCLARANPKLFFREGDELWGASAIPYSAGDKVPREMTREDIARLVEAHASSCVPVSQVRLRRYSDSWRSWVWYQPVPLSSMEQARRHVWRQSSESVSSGWRDPRSNQGRGRKRFSSHVQAQCTGFCRERSGAFRIGRNCSTSRQ